MLSMPISPAPAGRDAARIAELRAEWGLDRGPLHALPRLCGRPAARSTSAGRPPSSGRCST